MARNNKVRKGSSPSEKRISAAKKQRSHQKRRAKENERAVLYVGHIPHGFYEAGMRGFFSQFGDISRLRLCRSSRNGNSKGYAFIEFREPEVAKIAAETMDGYMMFERRLRCHVVPTEVVHRDTFRIRASNTGKILKKTALVEANVDSKDKVATRVGKMQKKINNLARLSITAPFILNNTKIMPPLTTTIVNEKDVDASKVSTTTSSENQRDSLDAVTEKSTTSKPTGTTTTRKRKAAPLVTLSPSQPSPVAARTRLGLRKRLETK